MPFELEFGPKEYAQARACLGGFTLDQTVSIAGRHSKEKGPGFKMEIRRRKQGIERFDPNNPKHFEDIYLGSLYLENMWGATVIAYCPPLELNKLDVAEISQEVRDFFEWRDLPTVLVPPQRGICIVLPKRKDDEKYEDAAKRIARVYGDCKMSLLPGDIHNLQEDAKNGTGWFDRMRLSFNPLPPDPLDRVRGPAPPPGHFQRLVQQFQKLSALLPKRSRPDPALEPAIDRTPPRPPGPLRKLLRQIIEP